jgi:hypothetical protein
MVEHMAWTWVVLANGFKEQDNLATLFSLPVNRNPLLAAQVSTEHPDGDIGSD